MPTLRGNGDYDVEVRGESNYQDTLVRVAGKHTKEGRTVEVDAVLFLEPNNPHDRNAIRVEIGGKPVGYIPREDAPEMRTALKQIGIVDGHRVGVDAVIVGGRIGESYGVWLDIDLGEAYYDAEDEDDEDDDDDAPDQVVTRAPVPVSVPATPAQPPEARSGVSVLVTILLVLVTLFAIVLMFAYALR